MRLKIDNFYHDINYGTLKYQGIKDGNHIFLQYEKSQFTKGRYSGWLTTGQRINIDPEFMKFKIKQRSIRSILPPE